MSKRTISAGEVSGYIDADGLVESLLKQLGANNPLVKKLEEERDKILEQAKADWPVKTGKSKDGLVGYEALSPNNIVVGIRDDVPYTYYIKGKEQAGKSTWQELVNKPMKAKVKELTFELADELIKAAKKEG